MLRGPRQGAGICLAYRGKDFFTPGGLWPQVRGFDQEVQLPISRCLLHSNRFCKQLIFVLMTVRATFVLIKAHKWVPTVAHVQEPVDIRHCANVRTECWLLMAKLWSDHAGNLPPITDAVTLLRCTLKPGI